MFQAHLALPMPDFGRHPRLPQTSENKPSGALQRPVVGQIHPDSADTELLALILKRALPERHASDLTSRLLAAFGDLNRVISATPTRLAAISGVNEVVVAELKLIETCARRMARARLLDQPVISSWQALLDYCHTLMSHRETEQLRVLYLDRRNRLITDEVLGDGTVDHVPVYPREILRKALEINASALILVHNHPSGDPTPSQSDITMTEEIRKAAELLSITLHDHVILGKSCEVSFRGTGLL